MSKDLNNFCSNETLAPSILFHSSVNISLWKEYLRKKKLLTFYDHHHTPITSRKQERKYILAQIDKFLSLSYVIITFSTISACFRSIHLSNHSIQKNYENANTRDKNLPDDNMWDWETFQSYLEDRGYSGLWDDVIVPGMKKAIICSMLCAQDAMEARKVRLGYDFV